MSDKANAERVTISVEMLNKIMNVLGNMPYVQVANVLGEIQQDIHPIVMEPEEKRDGVEATH